MIELLRTNGDRILVNPSMVSALLRDQNGDVIVRMGDGRGFRISGTYAEVATFLGFTVAPEAEVAISDAGANRGEDV